MRHYVSLALCTALFFASRAAPAQATTLTHGQIAKFVDRAGTGNDKAIIKFARDQAIAEPLPNASCPTESSIRLITDRHDIGVVPLGCNLWRPTGDGFKYVDKEGQFGGVQRIIVKPTANGGTLLIKLKGDNYGFDAINGPIDFLEVHLTIGAIQYCGRFQVPQSTRKKNDPNKVIFKGSSTGCL